MSRGVNRFGPNSLAVQDQATPRTSRMRIRMVLALTTTLVFCQRLKLSSCRLPTLSGLWWGRCLSACAPKERRTGVVMICAVVRGSITRTAAPI